MEKEQLRSGFLKMLDRKIFLCGGVQAVNRFIKQYGAKLNISGILALPSREVGEEWAGLFKLFYRNEALPEQFGPEYPIFQLLSRPEAFHDGTIIICQNGIYGNDIERLLDFYGYEYRHDYLFDFQAAAVLDTRRIALFHGYFCFARDLLLIMKEMPAFNERFLGFPCVYEEEIGAAYHRGLNDLVHLCDVYVYNQESRPYYFTPEQTPPDCMRICFPCVNFAGFYPQIQRVNLKFQNEFFIEPAGPSLPYKFGDREINAMLAKGIPTGEILEHVCAEDYFDHTRIRSHFQREMRIMRLYERNCDVKLADYLEQTYQTTALLYCNDHWTEPLAAECARQVAGLLGIRESSGAKEFVNPKRHSQIPVYPSVARALGITWATEQTRYYIEWGNGPELTTFRQYVLRYCEVVGRMKEIQKIW